MSSGFYTDKILEDLEATENGFFQIESKGDAAYLKIVKPGSKGQKVEYKDVLARIRLFGVENFETEQIKRLVANPDGKEYKIGTWSKGHPEDTFCEVSISEDQLKATVTILPPKHGGSMLSETILRESLVRNGIEFGILTEKFTQLIRNPEFFVPIPIAEGLPVTNGSDERIELKFRTDNKPVLEEDERGRVDFKNTEMIQSIKAGDTVAEKIPLKLGKPGKTVKGEEIPCAESKSIDWKIGKNVFLEGSRLLASISGRPVIDPLGVIRVDEVIQLSSVDYSTGNIDFPGTIIVEDAIADGFSLNVAGSLIIKSSIGKVYLKAKGDIILMAGFMGRGEGYIESEGNIVAKFVEQGKLISGGTITIEEASMHSELSAKDYVLVQGGRGEIIGGITIAGNYVKCSKLGAVVETKTRVSVGTPPELQEELNRMKREATEKENLLKKVQLTLQKLIDIGQKRDLTQEEKENLNRLKDANEKQTKLLEALRKQFDLALGSYEPNRESYVETEKEIFPGVEISFGVGKNFKVNLNSMMGKYKVQLSADGSVFAEKLISTKDEKSSRR